MSAQPPVIDARRRAEFRTLLQAHARGVVGGAEPAAGADDWLAALLEIVARMESEVARRLDRVPEKQQRNFVDWLGVKPRSARAARLAAVFKAALRAQPLTAPARVKLQSQTGVIFETDQELTILPGAIQALVAVAQDRIMLPPPGLFDPATPPPEVVSRQLVTLANTGATQLQVTPALGLAAGDVIRVGDREYRVSEVKGDLVQIDPPLEALADEDAPVERVTDFAPAFNGTAGAAPAPLYCCLDGKSTPAPADPAPSAAGVTPAAAARDWQLHELYLGDDELLDITAEAEIEVVSETPLAGVEWRYFGKAQPDAQPAWSAPLGPKPGAPDTLEKPQGSVEPTQVGGVQARWLRARGPVGGRLKMRDIRLKITSKAVVGFEAVANAAPVSSLTDFYPLGAEPRLFDSFYLGSTEAFSKAGAEAKVTITVPNATLGPFATAPLIAGEPTQLFAVGLDGLLYRITQPATDTAPTWASLDGPPNVKLSAGQAPTAALQGGLVVAAAAETGGEIWLWRNEKWSSLGSIGDAGATATPVAGVRLYWDAGALRIAAVRGGILYAATLTIPAADQTPSPPTWAPAADLSGYTPSALVGAGAAGLSILAGGHLMFAPPGGMFDDIAPAELTNAATLELGRGKAAFAAMRQDGRLGYFTTAPGEDRDTDLPPGLTAQGAPALAPVKGGGSPLVLLLASGDLGHSLVVWQPDLASGAIALPIDETVHRALQPPAPIGLAPGPLTPPTLLLAGSDADLAHVTMKGEPFPGREMKTVLRVELQPGWALIEVSDSGNPAKFDYFEHGAATVFGSGLVVGEQADFTAPVLARGLEDLGQWKGSVVGGKLVYQSAPIAPSTQHDTAPAPGDVIWVQGAFHRVVQIAPSGQVQVTPALAPSSQEDYVHYGAAAPLPLEPRPLVTLTATAVAAVAAAGPPPALYISGGSPAVQTFELNGDQLLLGSAWATEPAANSNGVYAFEGPPAELHAQWQAYDVAASPALSWEYWNGTGWWTLALSKNTTRDLRHGGDIVFTIPRDLQKTEVIGKSNFWIRARLVGGDYGHESFKLKNEPGPPGSDITIQSIERDTSAVRAPRILSLTICYAGPAVAPKHVLTHDNLGWRDQSDANRSPGAVMAVFETFGEALAASGPAAPAAPAAAGASDDPCACGQAQPTLPEPQAKSPGPEHSDGLYIGLDTRVTTGSVRLYLDVGDRADAQVLRVEALRDGVFTDAKPADETEGLAQSGLLTLALDHETTAASLFGQTLHWIRIGSKTADQPWSPVIRRLFLNAAWASAAETQQPEVLGSSDGAPDQVHTLTRNPVLPGSLELRVREALDDEQAKDLADADPDRIKSDPKGFRPGRWVRWDEVGDPLDCPPDARAYSLDEATGEVRFGDAAHGRPPPPGVDNIAAFTYRRGGGAAANGLPAGQGLQLTSPLPGVEAVTIGAGSAGGADVAGASTTLLRAPPALWSRGRTVSLRDLEQQALGSGPEIVQARAERLRTGGVRVVAVVAGADPRPDRRASTALQAYLTSQAGPALQSGRLRVQAPVLRPLALELDLVVADTDHTGAVLAAISQALKALFDPATGGWDGQGWPVGAAPGDADIAGALVAADGVLAVDAVRRRTRAGQPFPDRLPLSALVVFDPADVTPNWQVDA